MDVNEKKNWSCSDDEETDEEDENGPSSAPEVLEEVLGNDDVETVSPKIRVAIDSV